MGHCESARQKFFRFRPPLGNNRQDRIGTAVGHAKMSHACCSAYLRSNRFSMRQGSLSITDLDFSQLNVPFEQARLKAPQIQQKACGRKRK
jgi:hypothetical protein